MKCSRCGPWSRRRGPIWQGYARLHKVVFDRGFLDGVDLWWLDQHGLLFVVPAKDNMAVTVDAQAQAAAGEGVTVGRRAHTVRHGQGKSGVDRAAGDGGGGHHRADDL